MAANGWSAGSASILWCVGRAACGKGVFITTSAFTARAIDFARSVERIVLVDGDRLSDLMIEYEVGVTARTVKVPKLDRDYFEEE